MTLKTHAPLQTRVGIATGLVVVGDLIGSGASQEQAIVGETPNLAARLQGIAEPNSVVIAESTRKLVGNLFELEDLGAQGPQGHRGAGASLGGAATEFGRKPLRGYARERPDRACRAGRRTRTAAAALVEGKERRRPSGVALRRGRIGKSRLTAALLERLASEPHTRLRYFCSPQHTDSALYPIISQMERAAGFAHDDTRASKARQARCGAGADLDLQARTRRSLPRCCRCRTMDAIPRSI